jgi:antitoxin (DNA-binding transcriptional repressor) of toxin-antitoxin stability system
VKRVNIHDAKTNLSRLLCNRNRPVAEIRSLRKRGRKPRIGAAGAEFAIPDSFFDPLPDEVLKAFSGK